MESIRPHTFSAGCTDRLAIGFQQAGARQPGSTDQSGVRSHSAIRVTSHCLSGRHRQTDSGRIAREACTWLVTCWTGITIGSVVLVGCGRGLDALTSSPRSAPGIAEPRAEFSGFVRDLGGVPINGAQVNIVDGRDAGLGVLTDRMGSFSIGATKSAVHVRVSKTSFDGRQYVLQPVPLFADLRLEHSASVIRLGEKVNGAIAGSEYPCWPKVNRFEAAPCRRFRLANLPFGRIRVTLTWKSPEVRFGLGLFTSDYESDANACCTSPLNGRLAVEAGDSLTLHVMLAPAQRTNNTVYVFNVMTRLLADQ